jgi:hypothetical protein
MSIRAAGIQNRGFVNLGKILLIPGQNEPALEPRINNLEADKCPRQALKWINLTVPPNWEQVILSEEMRKSHQQ